MVHAGRASWRATVYLRRVRSSAHRADRPEIAMSDAIAEAALARELARIFEDPTYRPSPLPQVATELLGLTTGGGAEVDEFVEVLARDRALANSVLSQVAATY